MIGQITGKLIYKKAPNLVIDCNGIGYEIEATLGVFTKNTELNQDITIYTHLSIRDDAHILFGFESFAERNLFRILIKVNGIGPKSGVLILSGMSPSVLQSCIANEDITTLMKLPGIGKKTAQRLIVELKDKLKTFVSDSDNTNSNQISHSMSDDKNDAIQALVSLGYKLVIAEKMVNSVYKDDLSSEELIKLSLANKLK